MTFKKAEKEIVKAIVKYEGQAKSLAEVLNMSRLLEKKGIAIVQYGDKNLVFLKKEMYGDGFEYQGLGNVAELLSLIDTLVKKKYIMMIPVCESNTLVIGARNRNGRNPMLFP